MTLAQLLALGLFLVALPALRAELLISEIMPGTEHDYLDEEGKRNDWVELHNSGSEEISLEGHALTDDPENLLKWEFPVGSLKPGDYLTVFASGEDRKGQMFLHTNFKLKSEGEYLASCWSRDAESSRSSRPPFPRWAKVSPVATVSEVIAS